MQALTEATSKLLRPLRNIEREARLSIDLLDGENFSIAAFTESVHVLTKSVRYYSPGTAQRELIGRFGEHKEIERFEPFLGSSAACYKVAATDLTAILISALWPKTQLYISDEAKTVLNYHRLTHAQQNQNALRIASYRETKIAPEHSLEFSSELPLATYQEVGLVNSFASEGYGLFMEQGTGKTAVAIATACNIAKKVKAKFNRPARILIVCPNNVRLNWRTEFENFGTVQGKVSVVRGDAMARINFILRGLQYTEEDFYTALVCSYGTLVESWEALGVVSNFDLAVLDESHYIKNPSTKRFQYALKLRDKATKRLVLTGTPISNTPLDLYAQFEFMGAGWSGFRSWKNFKQFYGVYEKSADGFESLVACQNLPMIQERLARCSFIISKKEALPDLPEKVSDIVDVEMSELQNKAYKSLRDSLAVEIETRLSSDEPKFLVVNSILTQLLKLAQITSGFFSVGAEIDQNGSVLSEGSIEIFEPNPKIEALLELLKDKKPEEKTIIWACWTQDIRRITEACKLNGIDVVSFYGATSEKQREEAERRFNFDPTCKVFIGNPAAGGAGLNLLGYPPGAPEGYTTNADHTIYFSQNWSAVARSQSSDRNHRRGTRVPVRVTDLCVAGSIDEEIRNRVLQKQQTALEISDLRKILSTVLSGGYNG